MAYSVPSTNGFVVVTHVFPQQDAQNATSPQNGVVSTPPSLLVKFLKGEPTAMGTVQIMIGVVVFLFGIFQAFHESTGIMVLGAIIYITAGSLTVSARKKLSPCLVKASLGMNIISTVTAGIAILMHSTDLSIRPYGYYDYSGNSGNSGYSNYYEDHMSMSKGIVGVMLVLSVLEFIVSICVSAFACKATCSSNAQVMYQVPPSAPTSHFGMPSFQSSVVPPAYNSTELWQT